VTSADRPASGAGGAGWDLSAVDALLAVMAGSSVTAREAAGPPRSPGTDPGRGRN
jgi:hypothetical protein